MKNLISVTLLALLLTGCNQASNNDKAAAKDTNKEASSETKAAPEVKTDATEAAFDPNTATSDLAKQSYAIGAMTAKQIVEPPSGQPALSIDTAQLVKGFADAVEKNAAMQDQELFFHMSEYQKVLRAEMEQKQELAAKAGRDFLTENLKKEGVKATESGLQYQVVQKGDGKNFPKATDVVRVHYTGKLIDGTQFDSSVERGVPAEFPLNRVIPGWTEGLQLMSIGAKYKFYIPFELAYGAQGRPPTIPPSATLVFDVELFEINPKNESAAAE